jgi:hypothetical protein
MNALSGRNSLLRPVVNIWFEKIEEKIATKIK